jgi:hypothetical protein
VVFGAPGGGGGYDRPWGSSVPPDPASSLAT